MRLDAVHDLQKVFRKVLAATADPGSIADLSGEVELLDLDLPLNKGMLLVALALLDAETTFFVAAADSEASERTISQMTYAKTAGPAEADFVFAFGTGGATKAISSAKAGSLVDPHLGATVVLEVESLEAGGPLVLSGPGIESKARLRVGLDPGWIAARAAKNVEFPLGVDLVLVDRRFRLAALPRTTLIREDA